MPTCSVFPDTTRSHDRKLREPCDGTLRTNSIKHGSSARGTNDYALRKTRVRCMHMTHLLRPHLASAKPLHVRWPSVLIRAGLRRIEQGVLRPDPTDDEEEEEAARLSASSTPPWPPPLVAEVHEVHSDKSCNCHENHPAESRKHVVASGSNGKSASKTGDDDEVAAQVPAWSMDSEDEDFDDITDADFVYGPQLPDPAEDCVMTDDEIAAQVAVAMHHLHRLDLLGAGPQTRALFVRWTIHNWATQGPFNLQAYRSQAAIISPEFHVQQAAVGIANTHEAEDDILHDSPTRLTRATVEAFHPARKNAQTLDDEAAVIPEAHRMTSILAQRMQDSQRRPRPPKSIDNPPLGQIAGAGSVIVSSDKFDI